MVESTPVHVFPQTMEMGGEQTTINPSAVETPHGLLLIDVGYPGTLDQVERNLEEVGHGVEDVHAVLLTHHDGDHAGGLSELLEKTDATVYAHETCAPHVDGREDTVKSPDGERYPAVPVDVELVGGERFRTEAGPMEVVYTPGHTAGHLSLYLPEERLLIAADALTADEDGLQGPSTEYTLEMDEALDSAEELAGRDTDRVLCFHGGLVEADGNRIREVVDAMR